MSAAESSMPERPKSDRDLNEAIALDAVREQFPSLGCRRAAHLGSGWAADVYLLDERFVARFPRNAETAEWVDWDQALLGLVATSLADAFSVPRLVGRGKAGLHFPHDFLVCELVPGVGADHLTVAAPDELVTDLGLALTAIHSVSVEDARKIGVHQADYDAFTGTPRFLHGDFNSGNIILDPTSGRLVGVIDWGNAAVGDPALDFMSLVLWRGWDFTHAVLKAYKLPTDDGFLDRLRYHARMQSLQWLTDSVKRGLDPEYHLMWLRNAFSLDAAPPGLIPNPQASCHPEPSGEGSSSSR